ncbi:MAG: hypothetical protein B6D62_00855 [Candidatus Cloacimonas sp. 4484_275]|nr:MAG: hypothetical protein B6D62_00855 [Candidatus Cloacimonas sp. 4484_275]
MKKMKKFFGLLVLLLFVVNLTAIKNWKLYTNTTYIYDILRVGDNLFIASWGGLEIFTISTETILRKNTPQSTDYPTMISNVWIIRKMKRCFYSEPPIPE